MGKLNFNLSPNTVKFVGKLTANITLSLSALFVGLSNIPLGSNPLTASPISGSRAFAQTTTPSQAVNPNPAAQNEIISQPGVPILSFDVKNLSPILTEMKILWQERKSPDGQPFILANAQGDIVFILSPLSCSGPENTDCLGLQLVSVFDDIANENALNDFNTRYAFAHMNINASGNAYLSRYDIADYGIARGNVATIIQTFAGLSRIYQNSFATQTLSSNQTSDTNLTTKIVSYAPPSIEKGKDATRLFEANSNLSAIFDDDALPTNKIRNITP